jgi:hypothetical protein
MKKYFGLRESILQRIELNYKEKSITPRNMRQMQIISTRITSLTNLTISTDSTDSTDSTVMIKKFTIFGERCSGTNYLEELITANFDVNVTWDYGWKHFFGFNDLKNSDDTLFIGIVRNPYDWINSLYKIPYHIPDHIILNVNTFLNSEFYSFEEGKEIIKDRNIYNPKKRYKNIFQMRYVKLDYLINHMPRLVKNYIFIKYEDLIDYFNDTMNKIQQKGLTIRENINYPVNKTYYKKDKNIPFEKDTIIRIPKEEIQDKLNTYFEKDLLNYDI